MKKPFHRQVLGRGLDALLGEQDVAVRGREIIGPHHVEDEGGFVWLAPENLHNNPKQPRVTFDEVSLDELGHSIRSKGVLQPLLVRKVDKERYEIIAGERRWRAAQLVGVERIPCRILEASDEEMMEIGLLENIQRDNLNAVEEANGYQYLIDLFDYTQEKLAHRIGKSRSHIANMLRLLQLPEMVQRFILDGTLSVGHAKVILGSSNPEVLAQEVIEKKLTVRQTEYALKKESAAHKQILSGEFPQSLDMTTEAISDRLDFLEREECLILEKRLKDIISARYVKVQYHQSGIDVHFHFQNLEDLERFIDRTNQNSL